VNSPFSPDERGLHGASLDLYVRQIFASLSPDQIRDLSRQIYETALRKELVYYRDGKIEVINVLMRPLAMFSEQLNYFRYVSQTLLGALKRMPELYLKDFQVREIVPLDESESKWLWDTWGASHNQFHTVFGRLDAVADLSGAFAKDSLGFIEANLAGAGGIHLISNQWLPTSSSKRPMTCATLLCKRCSITPSILGAGDVRSAFLIPSTRGTVRMSKNR
jgi:hypothetical protein